MIQPTREDGARVAHHPRVKGKPATAGADADLRKNRANKEWAIEELNLGPHAYQAHQNELV